MDTFNDINLALARVSILSVEVFTVNGPREELAAVSLGKSFKSNCTFAFPV